MTEYTRADHADLLARARAALETPDDLDGGARDYLIEDIAVAEHRLTLSPLPWPVEIHLGIIEHRSGLNTHATFDHAELIGELAQFAREWWSEIDDPRDAATLGDAAVVDCYFEDHASESVTIDRITIDPPADPARPVTQALERGRYCVLSTAHLTVATADLLDLWASWPPGNRPIDIAAAVHGWFVPTRVLDAERANQLPEDLASLIAFGRTRGFAYVLIDCDADVVDGLPAHDW